jgi:hypothetical protein
VFDRGQKRLLDVDGLTFTGFYSAVPSDWLHRWRSGSYRGACAPKAGLSGALNGMRASHLQNGVVRKRNTQGASRLI